MHPGMQGIRQVHWADTSTANWTLWTTPFDVAVTRTLYAPGGVGFAFGGGGALLDPPPQPVARKRRAKNRKMACILRLRVPAGTSRTAPKAKAKPHAEANQGPGLWSRAGNTLAVVPGTLATTVKVAVPDPVTVGDAGFTLQVKRLDEGAQASDTGTPIPYGPPSSSGTVPV
jgi:hypothetical protein